MDPNQGGDSQSPESVLWAVLRPKIGWRIVLPPLFGLALAIMVAWSDDKEAGPLMGWVTVVGFGLAAIAAWRLRIELRGGTLRRRGFFRSSSFAAADIEEVQLHYETTGRDYPHRVLTLITYDRRHLTVSFRWWKGWWILIRWLVEYCTRTEGDQLVWAVRTDARTRDRLEAYAGPLRRQPGDSG